MTQEEGVVKSIFTVTLLKDYNREFCSELENVRKIPDKSFFTLAQFRTQDLKVKINVVSQKQTLRSTAMLPNESLLSEELLIHNFRVCSFWFKSCNIF